MLRLFVLLVAVFVSTLSVGAVSADDGVSFIYLVRHAEKQSGSDPVLTPEGVQRSQNFAALLAQAGIKQILSTDYQRTRLTAKPLAESMKLSVEIYDPRDLDGLVKQLLSQDKTVFVVGHSNTTFDLAKKLGGDAGEPIGENEYDRIYQLVVMNGKVIHTNRLVSPER